MHHNAENRDQRSKESGLIGDVFQHLMSIETEPNKILTKKQFDKFKTHSSISNLLTVNYWIIPQTIKNILILYKNNVITYCDDIPIQLKMIIAFEAPSMIFHYI